MLAGRFDVRDGAVGISRTGFGLCPGCLRYCSAVRPGTRRSLIVARSVRCAVDCLNRPEIQRCVFSLPQRP